MWCWRMGAFDSSSKLSSNSHSPTHTPTNNTKTEGDGDGDAKKGGSKSKKGASKKDGRGPLTAAAAAAGAKKDAKAGGPLLRALRAVERWLTTAIKVNGKKLVPNSAVVMRFMAPLLLWAAAVVVVFGVSFAQLSNLQAPLSSLNAVAHVTYRISRVRVMGNFLAYSMSSADNAEFRADLVAELATLQSEYSAMLYGGRVAPVNPDVRFEAVAPASTFASEEFADLFFKTKQCLRADPSGCFPEGSEYYDITHSGLDAMVSRYIDAYTAFAALPDSLAYANHTLYEFINDVGGNDMVEGLYKAVDLFEVYTIKRFESVKTLHIILLVISLAIIALFVVFLFRPYVKLLHEESKDIAGLLSQLPAEVAIEDLAKTVVIVSGALAAAAAAAAAGGGYGAGPQQEGRP